MLQCQPEQPAGKAPLGGGKVEGRAELGWWRVVQLKEGGRVWMQPLGPHRELKSAPTGLRMWPCPVEVPTLLCAALEWAVPMQVRIAPLAWGTKTNKQATSSIFRKESNSCLLLRPYTLLCSQYPWRCVLNPSLSAGIRTDQLTVGSSYLPFLPAKVPFLYASVWTTG